MSKRQKFLITSVLLSLGFIGMQLLEGQIRFFVIAGLALLTLGLFIWSLKEGLGRNMTLLSLILPVVFTMGVGIFWFLLPASPFTRLPVIAFYAIGIYVLCLTSNIYTVGAIRTIALLRAARGVGFVLTLVTSFLIFDAIFSLRAFPWLTSGLVAASSFLLLSQGFWVIPLEKSFSKEIFLLAAISSLVLAELCIAIFFWPTSVVVGSLFLTIALYLLLGLGQARLEGRLFSQTVREYLTLGILVFLGMFLATRWGG
jgi:hypothetical protein